MRLAQTRSKHAGTEIEKSMVMTICSECQTSIRDQTAMCIESSASVDQQIIEPFNFEKLPPKRVSRSIQFALWLVAVFIFALVVYYLQAQMLSAEGAQSQSIAAFTVQRDARTSIASFQPSVDLPFELRVNTYDLLDTDEANKVAAGTNINLPEMPSLTITADANVTRPGWCNKPTTNVEKMTCADDDLATINLKAFIVYKAAEHRAHDSEDFHAASRAWRVIRRDSCTTKECLIDAYQLRMNELSAVVAPALASLLIP